MTRASGGCNLKPAVIRRAVEESRPIDQPPGRIPPVPVGRRCSLSARQGRFRGPPMRPSRKGGRPSDPHARIPRPQERFSARFRWRCLAPRSGGRHRDSESRPSRSKKANLDALGTQLDDEDRALSTLCRKTSASSAALRRQSGTPCLVARILLRIVGALTRSHPWPSRAGGGAVHSIRRTPSIAGRTKFSRKGMRTPNRHRSVRQLDTYGQNCTIPYRG